MGLGPSIKMTTLHHYNCPVTKRLLADSEVNFSGVIIDGVSENCDAKLMTAEKTAELADSVLHADGAIVAIDGWGNHHIDFVSVISELEKRKIACVGMSYIGQQGRLVCSNEYVSTIVDFNKTESGYETCVVGQNNITDIDAYKAVELLKCKLRKCCNTEKNINELQTEDTELILKYQNSIKTVERYICNCKSEKFKNLLDFNGKQVYIEKQIISNILNAAPEIEAMNIKLIPPMEHEIYVNSNLDFMPIACIIEEKDSKVVINELGNVKVMITGVEEKSGYQPANIGSSEGILSRQVELNQAGTPSKDDYILNFDFLFKEGEGRTANGIIAAHNVTDRCLEIIRRQLRLCTKEDIQDKQIYRWNNNKKLNIVLVKIVSGLGNMYDTALYPNEPGGVAGSYLLRHEGNMPVILNPLEVLIGKIHSFI